MATCVLIDGDSVLYRCGFAAEHVIYTVLHEDYICPFKSRKECNEYTDKLTVPYSIEQTLEVEPLENALNNVNSVMESILDEFNYTELRVHPYLSGRDNFRYKVATSRPYKGNRIGMSKPKHLDSMIKHMRDVYKAIVVDGIEADDAIAMHASSWFGQKVVVALDKDLDQIEGHHYNWQKKEHYFVSPEEADYNLYAQILTGDPTDNIEGVKGIGAKRAAKLLEGKNSTFEYWEKCKECYFKAYGDKGEERLMETARLVYLLRGPKDEFKPPSRVALEQILEESDSYDSEAIRASSTEGKGQV